MAAKSHASAISDIRKKSPVFVTGGETLLNSFHSRIETDRLWVIVQELIGFFQQKGMDK